MIDISRVIECFGTDFIGLRNNCDETSQSGYYLNDEVSIELSKLAKVATGEDRNGRTLFSRIQRVAIRDTAEDFLQALLTSGKLQSLKNSQNTFEVSFESNEILELSKIQKYKDLEIVKIENNSSETLYLQNGSDTRELDNDYIYFSSDKQKVFLYAHTAQLEQEFTRNCTYISDSFCNCGCYSYVKNEIAEKESTGCIRIIFKCECSYVELLCQNKMLLARPIFHHTVGLFYKEKLYSNNIDPYIQGGNEQAESLYMEHLKGYEDKESKYNESLDFSVKAAVSSLRMKGCFSCKGVHVSELL